MRRTVGLLCSLAFFSAGLLTIPAHGASVSSAELEIMHRVAAIEGEVRVMIKLRNQSLEGISQKYSNANGLIDNRLSQIIIDELGATAYREGAWTKDGLLGIYVKPAGLKILANSQNALTFMLDPADASSRTVVEDDGGVDALRHIFRSSNIADAEIILNIPKTQYRLLPNGSTEITNKDEVANAAAILLNDLAKDAGGDAFPSAGASIDPVFPAKVNAKISKGLFLKLQNDPSIRTLRPNGYVDKRSPEWSKSAEEVAQKNGKVELAIQLSGGVLFSPKIFWKTEAGRNQAAAHRAAAREIFSAAGIDIPEPDPVADTSGSYSILASYAQLKRLLEISDRRIMWMQENRGESISMMSTSVPTTNIPSGWASGYSGSNVAIALLDSGVRKTHDMFQMNGTTKIVSEGCFATDQNNWKSYCPSKDMFGDSPVGTIDAGEPWSDTIGCQLIDQQQNPGNPAALHRCGHGTMMASIAAGRSAQSVENGTLKGMAPDAQIISFNVFSYDRVNNKSVVFDNDIQKALQRLLVLAGTANSPALPAIVANISIGSPASYQSDCDSAYGNIVIRNSITQLTNAGVPVIASTGNYGIQNGISWPSCSRDVIKAAAVPNDGIGLTISNGSNIANSTNYTRPILLAPGGDKTSTIIRSAGRMSDNETLIGWGTSQAAAHLSGFVADIKSVNPNYTVDQIVRWIAANGSVPVTASIATGTYTWRRINFNGTNNPI